MPRRRSETHLPADSLPVMDIPADVAYTTGMRVDAWKIGKMPQQTRGEA